MIDPTKLTEADKGRGVIYRSVLRATGGDIVVATERGIITSWNAKHIFVAFAAVMPGIACLPESLEWEHEQ